MRRCGPADDGALGNPPHEAMELQVAEDVEDFGAVVVAPAALFEVEVDGGGAVDGDEADALEGPVAVLSEEVLLLLGQGVQVVIDALDGAELLHQLYGAFLTDGGDAGDVVGGVALKGFHVDELLRGEAAEALPDLDFVEGELLGNLVLEEDADAGRDELEEVGIAGEDDGGEALGLGLGAEGAEEVVGLVAVHLHDGDAEGLHEAAHVGELSAEVVRHVRALGLVLLELLVAVSGRCAVEGEDDVGGTVIFHGPADHLGEAVDAPNLFSGLGDGEGVADGVPGAMDHGVAVHEEEEGFPVHGHLRLVGVVVWHGNASLRGWRHYSVRRGGRHSGPPARRLAGGVGGAGVGWRNGSGRLAGRTGVGDQRHPARQRGPPRIQAGIRRAGV